MKDNTEAVTARKVVQLFQLPRILVLHLKRFSYTLNGTGKIHKPINYGERLRCSLLHHTGAGQSRFPATFRVATPSLVCSMEFCWYVGRPCRSLQTGDESVWACRLQPSWVAELCPEPRHRGGAEYELIAAVLHHGKTPSAGHYTADVRQSNNKWLRFDDADLSYVPVDRVINDARAYLLFYQLRG